MGKDKSLIKYPESYVVLDIETTGFSRENDEIIELSALRVVDNQITEEFTELINPQRNVPYFITNLTGISGQMLKNAPKAPEVLKRFVEFVSDSIIMGHNVTFDIGFIDNKLKKYFNAGFDNDYIDTLKIARKMLPSLKSKKLGMIAQHFELNTDGMHRGLKDCAVTNMCYQKFLQMHKQQNVSG